MFGKKNEEDQRFYIKSSEDIPTLGRIIVLVDRETASTISRPGSAAEAELRRCWILTDKWLWSNKRLSKLPIE